MSKREKLELIIKIARQKQIKAKTLQEYFKYDNIRITAIRALMVERKAS